MDHERERDEMTKGRRRTHWANPFTLITNTSGITRSALVSCGQLTIVALRLCPDLVVGLGRVVERSKRLKMPIMGELNVFGGEAQVELGIEVPDRNIAMVRVRGPGDRREGGDG